MREEELNKEIEKIQKSVWNIQNFYNLMLLIEKKIREVSKDEDLKHFSSIVKNLNLSKEDTTKLVALRNPVFHSFTTDEEINSAKDWIISTIIPAVLSYSSKKEVIEDRIFEESITKKLIQFGENLGFQVVREGIIPLGSKKIEIDFIFKRNDDIQIIFEFKSRIENDIRDIGIQQLLTYLTASKSKIGVLVVPGSEYEELDEINLYGDDEEGYKILIFGVDTDLKILNEWIKSNIELDNEKLNQK